jgi:hypothetical protein
VAVAFVDLYSGERMSKNLMSEVGKKVTQYQESFTNLKLELQQHAVIHTEIIVLRVLDAVGDLCEFSE